MKSQSPLIGAFVPGQVNIMAKASAKVSIPSDRGIRSGIVERPKAGTGKKVSIPSDRGIRSGSYLGNPCNFGLLYHAHSGITAKTPIGK